MTDPPLLFNSNLKGLTYDTGFYWLPDTTVVKMNQAGLPSDVRHDRAIQPVSIASQPILHNRTAVHDRVAAP